MSENQNKKTLFIYDLDNSISDKQLTQAFKEEGYNVNYIRVNKSKYPNGLNTAFVNFETEESAAKALETLNHLTLGKTELFIVYATNKPVGQQFVSNPKKTVFVKGLPKDIETVVLIKIFTSMFGDIENLRVMRDSNNESRGYGYITFKNEEDAQKAIDLSRSQEGKPEKTEFEINGERKSFDFDFQEYVPKDSRPEMWTNTYIRNLPERWNKEDLVEFAKKVGEPRSVIISEKKELGLHYGFSSFKSHEDAEKFLNLHSKPIDIETKEVVENAEAAADSSKVFKPYVSQAENKDERKKKVVTLKGNHCGLFVVEFGTDINLNDINMEFDKYGKIYSSTLYKEPKEGQTIPPNADSRFPRALILYKDPECAKQAIKGANGSMSINGKQLSHPLEVMEYRSRSRKTDPVQEQSNIRSSRRYNPPQQTNNNDNRDEPKQPTQSRLSEGEVRDKLKNDVTKYLEEKAPEYKDEPDKFLSIFNEMLDIDEMRKCVERNEYLQDYMKAILDEMSKPN